MAKIVSIMYQPIEQEYEDGRFDYFIREPKDTAVLVANRGKIGLAGGSTGVLAKVLTGGAIKVGDAVRVAGNVK